MSRGPAAKASSVRRFRCPPAPAPTSPNYAGGSAVISPRTCQSGPWRVDSPSRQGIWRGSSTPTSASPPASTWSACALNMHAASWSAQTSRRSASQPKAGWDPWRRFIAYFETASAPRRASTDTDSQPSIGSPSASSISQRQSVTTMKVVTVQQICVEMYNYKQSWIDLTVPDRRAFVGTFAGALAGLEAQGVGIVTYAVNVPQTDHRAPYDFFCVYRVPEVGLQRAF